MNIFKILASGDGSINEPNISAFLGYLLNPNEDHGLRDELLKRLLLPLFQKYQDDICLKNFRYPKKGNKGKKGEIDWDRDLISLKNSDELIVEVFFEQAFKDISEMESQIKSTELEKFGKENSKKTQKTKQIIHIVVIAYKKIRLDDENGDNKNRIAKKISKETKIRWKREPIAIFLIENKIAGIPTKFQLERQLIYAHAYSEFDKVKENIYTIYISPDHVNFETEWNDFEQKKYNYKLNEHSERTVISKGVQLFWNVKNNTTPDKNISRILANILLDETCGNIEPIQDYVKHSIKAFRKFILSDFKVELPPPPIIAQNKVSQEEFYDHCFKNKIRDRNEIIELQKIEENQAIQFESSNEYTVGDNPMISFYSEDNPFYLRIQLNKENYDILSFKNISKEIMKEKQIVLIGLPNPKTLNRCRYKLPKEKLKVATIESFV